MDKVALEIIYHLAEYQYAIDTETGQRWPTILPAEKNQILAFRSVCRAFRDASWLAFRDLLAERVFYLNEEDMAVLSEMSQHPRLAGLVQTLTFGSQVFTANGLRILEDGLQNHPSHVASEGPSTSDSPGAWQRTLSSRSSMPYAELLQFKDLYHHGLTRQERFWESGDAAAVLQDCLYRLSKQNLRCVRVCPRPCHVSFQVKGKSGLSFSARSRTSYWVPHGSVGHTRCNAWRNIDRTLSALAELAGRKLQLHDLRTSSMSNIRWPINSSIFTNTSLFANLRILQLSIREDSLVGDCVYAQSSSEDAAHQFARCLMTAPHLTSLDLEICSMGEERFASYALAHIAQLDVPFRLEHFVLEYNVQSEDVLTDLVLPHVATLNRLILLNSWITVGTWEGWLRAMVDANLKVDYLEIWKPAEAHAEIVMESAGHPFKLRHVGKISREGKVSCCLPQEQWDNCYPRFARR